MTSVARCTCTPDDPPGSTRRGVRAGGEAKDVLAGAMLKYARTEAEHGSVQMPRGGRSDKPTVTLLGEMFPADPVASSFSIDAAAGMPQLAVTDDNLPRRPSRAP